METQQWNPLPAISKFLARFAVGKLVAFLAGLLLLPIVIAAARATNGWIHLVFGLGVFSVVMALAQSAGALLASRGGRSAVVPLALTSKFWLVIPFLALWPVLSIAGISDDDKQPMLTGVAVGLATVLALWMGWGLIGRRWPNLQHQPARLLGWQWYLRLTMNAGGLFGGLVAIGITNR